MDANTIKAIQDALAPIADKIGQGATYTWTVVLKQQYVVAISDFFFSAFFLVLTIIFGFIAYKSGKKIDEYDGVGMVSWFSIFTILSLIVTATSLYDAIAHLINPGYYALDYFINLGKPTN